MDAVVEAGRNLARRPWLAAGCVGLLTFFVFLPAVACDFVNWDDNAYVYQNPLVLRGITRESIVGAFTRPCVGNWAPLTMLSYAVDASLYGPQPAGFHLTNVLVHALAAAILLVALTRMTDAPGRSAAAVLLFALHPLRVESIAWISERKDVLCVLMLACTLLAYEWYCRRPGGGRLFAVCTCMLVGLLAKATLVTLPALLLLLDVWPLGRLRMGVHGPRRHLDPAAIRADLWRVLPEKVPMLMVATVFVLITIRTQTTTSAVPVPLPFVSVRVPTAIHAVAGYLQDSAVPWHLLPTHPHPGPAGLPVSTLVGSMIGLCAVAVLTAVVGRRAAAVPVGMLWFIIALTPTLGLVQLPGLQVRNDRYTYVPHIGLMLAVVWGTLAVTERLRLDRRLPFFVLVTVLTLAVMRDRAQIAIWKDSATLWSHVLSLNPNDHLAQTNLGVSFFEKGRVTEAIPYFERSLEIRESERAHSWLGLSLAKQGRLDRAIVHYRAGLAIDPESVEAHTNLGIALARLGRLAEALPHFERVCELDPADRDAQVNLARARFELTSPAGGQREGR